MAEHTKGRIRQDPRMCKVIMADKDRSFAVAEDPENARRLVACWNACEGLTTEELERGQIVKAEIESPEGCDIVIA